MLVATLLLVSAPLTGCGEDNGPTKEIAVQSPPGPDRGPDSASPTSAMLERILADAARVWRVPSDTVIVDEPRPRRWPDQRLGCLPDRRAADGGPVEGFEVVVRAGGRSLTYHTAGTARFVRCPDDKPRGPLT